VINGDEALKKSNTVSYMLVVVSLALYYGYIILVPNHHLA